MHVVGIALIVPIFPLVALLLAGCGRIGFGAIDDAAIDDAPTDAATSDGGPMPSLCGIAGGGWKLSSPEPLVDINELLVALRPDLGDQDEFDPVFSDSGLELYFSSDQGGSWDVYVARRPTLESAFSMVEVSTVSTPTTIEFGFQPLASLDVAMISANFSGTNTLEYWNGFGLSTGVTWTLSSLSTADEDADARMSSTGLEVFVVRRAAPDNELRDIYVATRASVDADFSTAQPVAELNSGAADAAPAQIEGGLGLLFASQRDTALDQDDIYLATRPTVDAPFEMPLRLDALNSASFDGEPTVFRSKGTTTCEIVFVSNRSGAFNLFRSTVEPK